ISQFETTKTQWDAAQEELDSQDLKDKATELRAKAEEQDKLLDFAIDIFKAGIEILANPEEGPVNGADEIFTRTIKIFAENHLKKEAEEEEKEAIKLHRDSLTKLVERAKKATDELTDQIAKIGPLSDDVAASIERNVTRATRQYDQKDAAKRPNAKFRFS